MNKNNIFLLYITSVAIFLYTILLTNTSLAKVIIVDVSNISAIKTINEAVKQSQTGDVILVKPGVFYERVKIENKKGIIIRGMGAVISGELLTTGLPPIAGVSKGFEVAPNSSDITIEGFIFQNCSWGVLVSAERPKKEIGSEIKQIDRKITVRYNTFYRTSIAVGACSPTLLEANIFATDIQDIIDCGQQSVIISKFNRHSSDIKLPRAVLRRIDTTLESDSTYVAYPEFVNPEAGNFKLKDGSFYTNASKDGKEIGAYGVPAFKPIPEIVISMPPFLFPLSQNK